MTRKTKKAGELVPSVSAPDTAALLADLRGLIDAGRTRVAQAVNAGMVALYWGVGDRIRREILGERRAAYGRQIFQTLSEKLTAEYGRGFGPTNLSFMVRFAEAFPNHEIVQTLSAQLGWSHFTEIISLSDPLKRDFYAEMCRLERWSVRTLRANAGVSRKVGRPRPRNVHQSKRFGILRKTTPRICPNPIPVLHID
jgi:hypothetical protein